MAFNLNLCETFTSPTNIAVIKYWGKNDPKLNTPMNSSVSVTLDQKDLHTLTTVAASKNFTEDKLWLNGVETKINNRGLACLREIRALAGDRIDEKTGEIIVRKEDWPQYKVHISSVNTFPTGAGLASSAAGFACLVASLAKLFAVKEEYPGQISSIARQGSGSASRSLYGGFVRWEKGNRPDAKDSIAVQVADENHWPELRAVILVVSDKEKDISSTSGMETSKSTSPFLNYRAENIVDERLRRIEQAYLNHDFETFGQITMQDSNQFHSTCLDTYPPIFYMNDISRIIIRLVHLINEYYGTIKAAYTFDAGPNAVIYILDKDVDMLVSVMSKYFPPFSSNLSEYCNDEDRLSTAIDGQANLPSDLVSSLERCGRIPVAGDVKFMFITKPGPGPINVGMEHSLLNPTTGLPVPPRPEHKQLKISSTSTTTRSTATTITTTTSDSIPATVECSPIAVGSSVVAIPSTCIMYRKFGSLFLLSFLVGGAFFLGRRYK